MATLRDGLYGNYYGSLFSESESLTQEQMQTNAKYIQKFLSHFGWSKNAIAGILGNMQAESSLNPGRWQSESINNLDGGYGLVQWTPASKYINWCNETNHDDPSEMDNNLERIIFELENNVQWIPTDEYNLSFEEFSKSTATPEYLASAFLKCYERAGVEVEETRQANAREWFNFLEDTIIVGTKKHPFKNENGFNFMLFNKIRRLLWTLRV